MRTTSTWSLWPWPGELIVLESLKATFLNSPTFQGPFTRLLEAHDKEFNTNHKTVGVEDTPKKKKKNTSRVKIENAFNSMESFREAHED